MLCKHIVLLSVRFKIFFAIEVKLVAIFFTKFFDESEGAKYENSLGLGSKLIKTQARPSMISKVFYKASPIF